MPTQQGMNLLLNAYGVNPAHSGFTFAKIMAWIIFGIIGTCAFNYGRKEKDYKPIIIGLALMIYPYFISNTIWLYLIGVGVMSLLYFWRD